MEYLSLEQVSKSFGEKVLFDRINFTISKGDKIGLIARNGSGKTTLLKVIAGVETPEGERSRVLLNRNIKTSYLDQDPQFDLEGTVGEAIFDVDIPSLKALKNYELAMADGDSERIEFAMQLMDELKAWDADAKAKEILYKLHLTDLDQVIGTMSGGQVKRLALAQIILSEPDFLIMDEPTNHLDVEMIEWLEDYLSRQQLTILMVTHDRYFLERVCNAIIELDKGKIFPYSGNYSDYLEKKTLRSQQDNVSIDKAKKLLAKELEWVRRQPKARGTKAKSRVNEYKKLQDEVSSITYEEVFQIEVDSARLGKKIMELSDVHMAFDDKVIMKEWWYKWQKGERVGIAGPNGVGKTTFVNIIEGNTRPDRGKRILGETVQIGYYTQDGLQVEGDKRVIDIIRDIAEYIPLKKGLKLSAAALLERFMFDRKQQQVFTSQLSGGEKKRLHLLTVLIKNPNFLILDEPTNDLDLLTLNVLEDYLMQFKGCLMIISHDRYFMDKLVDHMFIFKGEGVIQDYPGNYSQWKAQDELEKANKSSSSTSTAKANDVEAPKEEKRKLSYHEKKEMQDIEKEIDKLAKRKKVIEDLFLTGVEDQSKIEQLSIELGEIRTRTDDIEMRWLELSEWL